MWSGGGESGLGNMFDSVPAFPESGLNLIIVHVLNITLMFCQKKEKRIIAVWNTYSFQSIKLSKNIQQSGN